jgi:hypothetical protein
MTTWWSRQNALAALVDLSKRHQQLFCIVGRTQAIGPAREIAFGKLSTASPHKTLRGCHGVWAQRVKSQRILSTESA